MSHEIAPHLHQVVDKISTAVNTFATACNKLLIDKGASIGEMAGITTTALGRQVCIELVSVIASYSDKKRTEVEVYEHLRKSLDEFTSHLRMTATDMMGDIIATGKIELTDAKDQDPK